MEGEEVPTEADGNRSAEENLMDVAAEEDVMTEEAVEGTSETDRVVLYQSKRVKNWT
jgi:hypothetical protein